MTTFTFLVIVALYLYSFCSLMTCLRWAYTDKNYFLELHQTFNAIMRHTYFQFLITCTYSTAFLHVYTVSSKNTATWIMKEGSSIFSCHTQRWSCKWKPFWYIAVVTRKTKKILKKMRKEIVNKPENILASVYLQLNAALASHLKKTRKVQYRTVRFIKAVFFFMSIDWII